MCHGVITQGKNRMRQFRTSGSVRGAAREGGSYRDNVQGDSKNPMRFDFDKNVEPLTERSG